MPAATPVIERPDIDLDVTVDNLPEEPWEVTIWNDPVNLVDWVVHVIMEVTGVAKDKAERIMLTAHEQGKARAASGAKSVMEDHCLRFLAAGINATVAKAGS